MFRDDHGCGSVKPPVHRSEFFSESLRARVFHFLWARPPELSQAEPPGHWYVLLLLHSSICALCPHGESIRCSHAEGSVRGNPNCGEKTQTMQTVKALGPHRLCVCSENSLGGWDLQGMLSGTQLKLSCFLWVHCRAMEGGSYQPGWKKNWKGECEL